MKNKISLLSLLLMAAPLAARYHSVGSGREFEKLIDQYPYAVVCFAPSGSMGQEKLESNEKRQVKDTFRSLESRVKSASEDRDFKRYLSKDVGFLVVDVASRRAHEVDEEYALKEFPTCLLFEQGKALSMTQIVKPTSKSDIISFLDKKIGDELDRMIKDRKDDERAEREERIARSIAYASYYPYGGWGWGGYGGWGWGGYGGFGYGRGLGYGWGGRCGRW